MGVVVILGGMFELRIERTFNAAHALRLADGSREPLHGHDWRTTVVVAAALDELEMVMDFHELEQRVDAAIGVLHHQTLEQLPAFAERNASAERVAEYLAKEIAAGLPERVTLVEVTVTEAPGCAATYRPE